MKDAATSAQRWAANLGASTEKIRQGVDAVTVAPGQAAARQKAVWLQNTTASVDKWAAATAAVTLQNWQADMKEKGLNRIAAGATAAVPKMTAFLTAFLPWVDQGVKALPARGGLEQNITRMVALVRHNAQFKRPASAR